MVAIKETNGVFTDTFNRGDSGPGLTAIGNGWTQYQKNGPYDLTYEGWKIASNHATFVSNGDRWTGTIGRAFTNSPTVPPESKSLNHAFDIYMDHATGMGFWNADRGKNFTIGFGGKTVNGRISHLGMIMYQSGGQYVIELVEAVMTSTPGQWASVSHHTINTGVGNWGFLNFRVRLTKMERLYTFIIEFQTTEVGNPVYLYSKTIPSTTLFDFGEPTNAVMGYVGNGFWADNLNETALGFSWNGWATDYQSPGPNGSVNFGINNMTFTTWRSTWDGRILNGRSISKKVI